MLDAAVAAGEGAHGGTVADLTGALAAMAIGAGEADRLLRGEPGVLALVDHPSLVAAVEARLDRLDAFVLAEEARIEASEPTGSDIEAANAALVSAKDVLWAIRQDRLRTAAAVADLAGRDAGGASVAAFYAVQLALSAIDRLEVRGRDSAGVHLFVWDHALDVTDPEVATRVARRAADPLFPSGAGAGARRRPVVRLQGGRRDRRARRQHAPRCGPRSRATRCCAWPWLVLTPSSRCSATRGGPASASSPSRTPTP